MVTIVNKVYASNVMIIVRSVLMIDMVISVSHVLKISISMKTSVLKNARKDILHKLNLICVYHVMKDVHLASILHFVRNVKIIIFTSKG